MKEIKYDDIGCLAFPLPEDIEKEKWSGHFDRARALIKKRLADEGELLSLKKRLVLELNNLDYIESRYTVTEKDALQIIRAKIPDMTVGEFEQMRIDGKTDWMYINEQVRYIDCFDATLYKTYPEIWKRLSSGDTSDYSAIRKVVDNAVNGEIMKAHIHIRHDFKVKVKPQDYGRIIRVHMPVPCERGSVSGLRIIKVDPKPVSVPKGECFQPVIYFETEAHGDESGEMVFSVEYELDNVVTYTDAASVAEEIDEMAAGEPLSDEFKPYLEEEMPHIRFTEYLCSVCEEIVGDEKSPLRKARKIYDWITIKTDYRFVRDYCSIDNLPEYCALNRRGDCGVQALLFITLCRIAGIPARWQSGLDAKPQDVGEHDWAMFYIAGMGWLYADLSYGGSSYIRGSIDRWNFYFGNVDPLRIPINDGFQKEFDPPKNHWRMDPYDNQCGEAEYDDRGLFATEVEYEYTDLGIKLT